jgi:prepilin-type N-terminal cleavage/methylation domain-containing protein
MKKENLKNQKGFTLIELMLVILIIGVLSGIMLSVINVPGIQAKSRDARRAGDLRKIQVALENYFADYRGYPASTSNIWQNVSTLSGTLSPNYINGLPTDPKSGTASGQSCYGKSNYNYYYISSPLGGCSGTLCQKYVLGMIVEVQGSATDYKCQDLSNCTTGAIACNCNPGLFCYAIQNSF